jgi:hypothetical protein
MNSSFLKVVSLAIITTLTILLIVYVAASFGDNKLGPLFALSIFYFYFFGVTIALTILTSIFYSLISRKFLKLFVFLGATCALLAAFGVILLFSGNEQNIVLIFICAQILLFGLVVLRIGYTKFI